MGDMKLTLIVGPRNKYSSGKRISFKAGANIDLSPLLDCKPSQGHLGFTI
jgi:hypothetical protein